MRNRTVLRRTRTRYLAARPSRTLDPGLGVTVKHSFLLLFSKTFLYSFNTFGHLGLLGALGLLITFPVLGQQSHSLSYLSFLSFIIFICSFIDVTLSLLGPCMQHRPAGLCLSY